MDLSRIKDLANRLSLTNLARSLNEIQGTGKEWRFLEKVLRTEQEIRDGNKEQMLIKRAKFPVIKTMDSILFVYPPKIAGYNSYPYVLIIFSATVVFLRPLSIASFSI